MYMENNVVKYLKLKGKSERFISLILKILQDNNITENDIKKIVTKD